MGHKKKRLPLKTVYYRTFFFLIVIPLLLVLLLSLLALNQQFKKQAIENIERAQENIETELLSDINVMSMRLSHLLYVNDNEILEYAAATATEDSAVKYEFEQKLNQAGNLALEPVKNVISVEFYMKDGKKTYIKSDIKREIQQIRETSWYQAALAQPNSVCVGAYDTTALNDLFTGGRQDLLVLVFALSPDVTMDRSQKIEMVTFYQTTDAGDTIKEYNQKYLKGHNKLGITRIVNAEGEVIFSALAEQETFGKKYTCVKTPIQFDNSTWYIESYIKTSELTEEFWQVACLILAIAVLILTLAGYFSGYFLRSVVKPVEEISSGLKEVEEGNLDVHIAPKGQYEIRTMIHQFNAMARRLKSLIEEYEERVRGAEKTPADYFAMLIKGEITPHEVSKRSGEFFMDNYVLMGLTVERDWTGQKEPDTEALLKSFERNSRFTARCIAYAESTKQIFILYRIAEMDYISRVTRLAEELQTLARREFGVKISVCISTEQIGYTEFEQAVQAVRDKGCLRVLLGEESVINLAGNMEQADKLLDLSSQYRRFAESLYTADEKNLVEERTKLFEILEGNPRSESEIHVYALILAIGRLFDEGQRGFADVFEKQYNYVEKLGRLEDIRSLKLWLTNYFAWIMDYSAAKLNIAETDVIVKAKRYMSEHYEDPNLSLTEVAGYVELNEKYFTNRFTKETGETFSAYLTGLRMQKARELLKTTTFKIYEISEMVGYHNVEHFNRMFKKLNGISPAQYRKAM